MKLFKVILKYPIITIVYSPSTPSSGRISESEQRAAILDAETRLGEISAEKTKIGQRVDALRKSEEELESRLVELKRRQEAVLNRQALADKFAGNKVSARLSMGVIVPLMPKENIVNVNSLPRYMMYV